MTLDEALDKFLEALRPGADAEALLEEIDREYGEVLEALASINNKLESLKMDRQQLKAMVEIELAHRPLH